MKERLGALPMLGMVAVGIPVTLAVIGFGYWVSDLVYAAGLWPLGMVMRIGLLLAVTGAGLWLLMMLYTALRTLIFGQDWLLKS